MKLKNYTAGLKDSLNNLGEILLMIVEVLVQTYLKLIGADIECLDACKTTNKPPNPAPKLPAATDEWSRTGDATCTNESMQWLAKDEPRNAGCRTNARASNDHFSSKLGACTHVGMMLYPRFRGCRQWHLSAAIPMRCAGVLRWEQCLRLMLGDKGCNTAKAVDLRDEEVEYRRWGREVSSLELDSPRSSAVALVDDVGPIINHAVDLICCEEESFASAAGR